MITLGEYVQEEVIKPVITTDDAELMPHLGKPWLKAWIASQTEAGQPKRSAQTGPALFDPENFKYHVMVVGKSGQGKTRMAVRLAMEQIALGASVVFLDFKSQTTQEVLGELEAARLIPPERIHLMLPKEERYPSWNPILTDPDGMDAHSVAAAFVSTVRAIYNDNTATRWTDALEHFVKLAAIHGLTLFEMFEMTQNPSYLNALLRRAFPSDAHVSQVAASSLRRYFASEYLQSKPDVTSITSRLRPIASDEKLGGLLWSERPSVNLGSFWKEQQALLMSVDEGYIPEQSARLIGGLLVTNLIKFAMRCGGPGKRPVVLFLDELAFTQQFLTGDVDKIAGMGRSSGLYWVTCCQSLAQLETKVRDAVTKSGTHVLFQVDKDEDAAMIAKRAAAVPVPYQPRSIHLSLASKRGDDIDQLAYRYPLYRQEAEGLPPRAMNMPPAVFEKVLTYPTETRLDAVSRALRHYGKGSGPYIENYYGRLVKAETAVSGLPHGSWRLSGPKPMELIVSFPRPKTLPPPKDDKAEREAAWRHRLLHLLKEHFVLRTPSSDTHQEVYAARFPVKKAGRGFMDAVLRKNVTPDDVSATMQRRLQRIADIVEADQPSHPPPKAEPAKNQKPNAPSSKPVAEDWGLDV